jgi:hypothetical protein
MRMLLNPPRWTGAIMCIALAGFSMLGSTVCAAPGEGDEGRMARIRASGQRFTTEGGEPFFPIADTAWLLVRLSNADIEHYIRTRSTQGFNIIKFGPESGDVDFSQMRFILDTLERHGMYAELYVPAYDYNADELVEANYAFAKRIADAFVDRANLFAYSLEGLDSPFGKRDPAEMRRRLIEAYRGIKSVDPERLVTFHPRSGRSVVEDSGVDPEYTDFYSVHRCNPGSIHDLISAEVRRTPQKPVFLTEPVYEGRGNMCGCNTGCSAEQVIEQITASIDAGAAGISYGHYSIWSFNQGTDGSWGVDPSPEGLSWRDALHSPGAQRVSELAASMKAHPAVTPVDSQTESEEEI